MTKKEILSELKNLDDYFRIHSWCTQMDEKISSFTAALDEKGRKHVTRWALDALEKENLESASQILAIIFLKLNDVPDRDLIRLLYTVLSGRLTYEDFNSLNNYIFNGKPPLSADLFYNITERVFIDKKSALKKALSISSIISEADPQLTIFYMTMLLCRVDLNNENKAMLNLLLYCVDADIPDEMAEGIRRSLSENADILEEILSETEDSRVRKLTGEVYRNLQDNRDKPEIISIEKKEPEPRIQVSEVPESQSRDIRIQEDSPQKAASASVHVAAPGEGSSESQGGSSPAYTVSGEEGEKRAGKPESSPLSGNKFSGRAEKKTESGGTGSPSLEKNFSQAENKSFSLEKESAFLGGGYSDTADAPVPRPGNGKDSSGKADKRDVKGKDDAASGISDSVTASAGPGSSGFSGESEPDKGEAVYEDTLPAETERPVKEYRIGVRKFSMKDLASLFKRGGRGAVEGRKTGESSVRSAGGGKTDKKQKKGRRFAGYFLLAALAAAGVFAAVVFFSSHTGGKQASPPPGGDKAASGQVVSGNAAPAPAAEAGPPVVKEEDAGDILHDRPEWIIKETSSGIEWTVQKGESVWKLYQYLTANSGRLTGRLKRLSEMDWLPFIHHVIRLNPDKNLALPIEPGDKFIIAE